MTEDSKPNRAVIFDLGAVLIDWDPRHLYRKLFDSDEEMEWFLAEVTTPEWNARHDEGLRWQEGVAGLVAEYPDHEEMITAYWHRWDEMLNGPIEGTLAILRRLVAAGYEVHALTNWSEETFPIARDRYDFLEWFTHIVVSGEEKTIKPGRRIFEILLQRIGRSARECIFIDDSARNIATAAELGFDTIHFRDPEQLERDLIARGIIA